VDAQLQQPAQAVIDPFGALSRGMDQVIRQEIRGALAEEFQALGGASRRAAEALETVRRAASVRMALWAVAVVLACASMPVIVAWSVLPSRAQLEQLRAERDRLQENIALLARRGGNLDLRRCGPAGRLCVRIERSTPAYGPQADYLVAKGY
jgi:hypothetical protein